MHPVGRRGSPLAGRSRGTDTEPDPHNRTGLRGTVRRPGYIPSRFQPFHGFRSSHDVVALVSSRRSSAFRHSIQGSLPRKATARNLKFEKETSSGRGEMFNGDLMNFPLEFPMSGFRHELLCTITLSAPVRQYGQPVEQPIGPRVRGLRRAPPEARPRQNGLQGRLPGQERDASLHGADQERAHRQDAEYRQLPHRPPSCGRLHQGHAGRRRR